MLISQEEAGERGRNKNRMNNTPHHTIVSSIPKNTIKKQEREQEQWQSWESALNLTSAAQSRPSRLNYACVLVQDARCFLSI